MPVCGSFPSGKLIDVCGVNMIYPTVWQCHSTELSHEYAAMIAANALKILMSPEFLNNNGHYLELADMMLMGAEINQGTEL